MRQNESPVLWRLRSDTLLHCVTEVKGHKKHFGCNDWALGWALDRSALKCEDVIVLSMIGRKVQVKGIYSNSMWDHEWISLCSISPLVLSLSHIHDFTDLALCASQVQFLNNIQIPSHCASQLWIRDVAVLLLIIGWKQKLEYHEKVWTEWSNFWENKCMCISVDLVCTNYCTKRKYLKPFLKTCIQVNIVQKGIVHRSHHISLLPLASWAEPWAAGRWNLQLVSKKKHEMLSNCVDAALTVVFTSKQHK